MTRTVAWQAGLSLRTVWLLWALTRAVCVVVVLTSPFASGRLGTQGFAGDVQTTYAHAHAEIWSGHLPYRDFSYEYPPGTLPFVLLPWGVPSESTYLAVYVGQMLVLDGAVLTLLSRRRAPGSQAAARLWLVGGAATLGLLLCRNDLPACLAAMAGLFAVVDGRRLRSALLLALGVLIKLWPIALAAVCIASLRGWSRQVAGGFVAVGAAVAIPVVALGCTAGLVRDLVGYHAGRGVEVEATAALPTLLWHALLDRGTHLTNDHSSVNLSDSGRLGAATTVVGIVAVSGLVLWLLAARRRRRLDLTTAGLLRASCLVVDLGLLTAKVFSPQYMLWLLGVSCVACAHQALGSLEARGVVAAMVLTTLVFPFDFFTLGTSGVTGAAPVVLLALRDAVLVALAWRWWSGLRAELA